MLLTAKNVPPDPENLGWTYTPMNWGHFRNPMYEHDFYIIQTYNYANLYTEIGDWHQSTLYNFSRA